MDQTPRLRMFAGPNGSGKSTLKNVIPPELLGVYINSDEIELRLRNEGFVSLSDYQVHTNAELLQLHFQSSPLLEDQGQVEFIDDRLQVRDLPAMSYVAAVAADFIRKELLKSRVSFSFETVMSHTDKIEIMKQAQLQGYRTYLYFIATDDPAINSARVKLRVSQGGHDVPEEKIRNRYYRSLDLLWDAIRYTSRAYIFDNSQDGGERTWLAEVTNGTDLEVKCDELPAWFKRAVWDKIGK